MPPEIRPRAHAKPTGYGITVTVGFLLIVAAAVIAVAAPTFALGAVVTGTIGGGMFTGGAVARSIPR